MNIVSRKTGADRPNLWVVKPGDQQVDPLDADYGPTAGSRSAKFARRPNQSGFVQIPDWVRFKLYEKRVSGASWACALELEHLVFRRHRNPVHFFSSKLRGQGLSHHTRLRALRSLEKAGLVRIGWSGRGVSPLVTCLWRSPEK
jgi:hypothetical protein